MSTPARRTGRPRSTAADRAILEATRTALVELGWARLTMSDIAARAGVAKTTLYRRWPGKSDLVVDAVAAVFDEQLELPESGSLRTDIEAVVLRLAALLERPETKAGLMALISESTRDGALRDRVRAVIVERQKALVQHGRDRAWERGELPPEPDPVTAARTVDLVFDAIAGTVIHRALVSAEPVDPGWASSLAQLLLHGLVTAPKDA